MRNSLNWKMKMVFVLGVIFFPRLVYGVGYEITEHNAKAMGLASAFVAWADNPSAIYYNPAGISQIQGPAVSLGGSMIDISAKLTNNDIDEDGQTDPFYIPNFFFSTPVNDKLSLGLGVYVPYGLGTEWDEDGITRYSSVKAELQTIFITPAIAWRINPKISIGGGISYIFAEAKMTRKFPFSVIAASPDVQGLVALGMLPAGFSSEDADVELTGEEQSWGWTAGILAQLTDKLSLGFSYRSETILKFKGDMEIDNISPAAQIIGGIQGVSVSSSYDTDAKLELPLPHRFSLGMAYDILSNWKMEFDYERILWSALDELKVDIDDENALFTDIEMEKDWKDTSAYKLGTEVMINENIALRAGGFYYQSPVPDKSLDPMIPDADNFGFALGAGYKIGGLCVDVGYMGVFSKDRSVNNDELEANSALLKAAQLTPGRDHYEHNAYELGLNIDYMF
jgi:long-chain fatty acid transport protein